MGESQRRLFLILTPSPSLLAPSYPASRPIPPAPATISHKGSRPKQVETRRRSLHLHFPSTRTMNPLLSGSVASDLPLIVFGRTSRSGTPMPQQPREKPPRIESSSTLHCPHPRDYSTSDREKRSIWSISTVESTFSTLSSTGLPSNGGTNRRVQATDPTEPKWPSEESFLPIPPSSPDIQKPPRPARNRAKLRRQVSINSTSTLDQIALGDGVEPKQITVSPSRSLWTHKQGLSTIRDDAPEEDTRIVRVDPPPGPLAEKRRAMNVRRAKKMHQVFGSEPPRALFQVTNKNPIPDIEGDHTSVFDKRGSVSTLGTASFLSPSSFSDKRRRASVASTIMTPPSTPTTPVLPQPESALESVLPRLEQSFTYTRSVTPPAFSNMLPVNTKKTVATPEPTKSPASTETTRRRGEKDFRQRRMRAAKLTNFFGVDYHDLKPHLDPRKKRTEIRKVEVAIDEGSGLPWDRHELRSLEMEDVIVRLRDLRSS